MSQHIPHIDDVFEENPDSWPSFEEMLSQGTKKKEHTYYRTHDIVRNIEAGYIEDHLDDHTKEKSYFRRSKLYGLGMNGIKTIKTKKQTKMSKSAEGQFKCDIDNHYNAAIAKIRDSHFIRSYGLQNLERHLNKLISLPDLRYLLHYECEVQLTMEETAALVLTYNCKHGKGHKACVNFFKLMPMLKRDTSEMREQYHTDRKIIEDEAENRKEKRSSKYKFHGYHKIYGPADEDHLASALHKMEQCCISYRKLHPRDFDKLVTSDVHGQLDPSMVRSFLQHNLSLKLTQLEGIAVVRYGDAFNAGSIPLSFLLQQLRQMSRGINYSLSIPKEAINYANEFYKNDDISENGVLSTLSPHTKMSHFSSAQTSLNTGGISTLSSSGGSSIMPVGVMKGLNDRRGKRHMEKFYVEAMVPKSKVECDKKLKKTLLTQLHGLVNGGSDVHDDEADVNILEYEYLRDLESGLSLGVFENNGDNDLKYDEIDDYSYRKEKVGKFSFNDDDNKSHNDLSIQSTKLESIRSNSTYSSVKVHNDDYTHHLQETTESRNKVFVPPHKSDFLDELEEKVRVQKARNNGQGFGGSKAHRKREKELAKEEEDFMEEATRIGNSYKYKSHSNKSLATPGSRMMLPTSIGHRHRGRVGGSSTIVRSQTPQMMVRPLNEGDTAREKSIAENMTALALEDTSRPQDIFRGDLKRYLQAGLTRLPLAGKSNTLRYITRWQVLYQLVESCKMKKVHPGAIVVKLREMGMKRPKIDGLIDPLADIGVWVERSMFVEVVYKTFFVLSERMSNTLFSALDSRKRGAIAVYELSTQLCAFCGADTLVTDGKRDKSNGMPIISISSLPKRITSSKFNPDTISGWDLIDSILGCVELEIYYWAQANFSQERRLPGESASEQKLRIASKKKRTEELRKMGVSVVDQTDKVLNEKMALTRGVCEAMICLMATTHQAELELLEATEAVFGRIAMDESKKSGVLSIKRPEDVQSSPVDRDEFLKYLSMNQKLNQKLAVSFRDIRYTAIHVEQSHTESVGGSVGNDGEDDASSINSLGEISSINSP